ncbi:hypothetical protein BMW24_001055 [Mycobacterium heckeshornense]|nr:hypothetical protein ACT16_04970 [Mycobacterium heckeshornense]PIJ37743.1 hypothetical protein BMW24_001055 [Mycobacterium heckeshornense]
MRIEALHLLEHRGIHMRPNAATLARRDVPIREIETHVHAIGLNAIGRWMTLVAVGFSAAGTTRADAGR